MRKELIALLTGPIYGLLFAVFLPFIGIAMAILLVGKKLFTGLARMSAEVSTFEWRPTAAYLKGKPKQNTEEKKNARSDKRRSHSGD
jgi:hypothetical protein